MSGITKSLSLIVLFIQLGCAALRLPHVTDIVEYERKTYPMIVNSAGAKLYTQYKSGSRVIKRLAPGTVLRSMGEAGSEGRVAYYHVRTLSGLEGWCQRWYVGEATEDEAEMAILRDKQSFETTLRVTILSAARNEIAVKSIHSLSRIENIWITSEVDTLSSASSYNVGVCAIMVGAILGKEKYQVDLKVNLCVKLDRDHLSNSTIEVNYTTLVHDKKIEEMPIQEKFNLLQLIFGLMP